MLASDPGQDQPDNRRKGTDQGQGVEAIDDVQGERFLGVQVQTEAARARRRHLFGVGQKSLPIWLFCEMWEVPRGGSRGRGGLSPCPKFTRFRHRRPAAGSVSLGTDRVTAPPPPLTAGASMIFVFLSHGAEVVDLTLNAIGSLRRVNSTIEVFCGCTAPTRAHLTTELAKMNVRVLNVETTVESAQYHDFDSAAFNAITTAKFPLIRSLLNRITSPVVFFDIDIAFVGDRQIFVMQTEAPACRRWMGFRPSLFSHQVLDQIASHRLTLNAFPMGWRLIACATPTARLWGRFFPCLKRFFRLRSATLRPGEGSIQFGPNWMVGVEAARLSKILGALDCHNGRGRS